MGEETEEVKSPPEDVKSPPEDEATTQPTQPKTIWADAVINGGTKTPSNVERLEGPDGSRPRDGGTDSGEPAECACCCFIPVKCGCHSCTIM